MINDHKKSREALVAENTMLHKELEEIRIQEKGNMVPDAIEKGDQFKKPVGEVPEYIYSIEFNKGKIISISHSPRCEAITGYAPREYAENPQLWMNIIHEKDVEKVRIFLQEFKEPLRCRFIDYRIIHKNGSVRWVRTRICGKKRIPIM